MLKKNRQLIPYYWCLKIFDWYVRRLQTAKLSLRRLLLRFAFVTRRCRYNPRSPVMSPLLLALTSKISNVHLNGDEVRAVRSSNYLRGVHQNWFDTLMGLVLKATMTPTKVGLRVSCHSHSFDDFCRRVIVRL